MRLPGLVHAEAKRYEAEGQVSKETRVDAKNFISREFVDVCSATYLEKVANDYGDYRLSTFVGLKSSLGTSGVENLKHIASDADKASNLLRFINKKSQDNHAQLDLLQAMIFFGTRFKGSHLSIANCEVSTLRLEKIRADYSKLSFNNCYFEEVIFDFVEHPKMAPNFEDCICETVLCVGDQALHLASFSGCEYETIINREQDLVDQSMTLKSTEEQIVYNLLRKIYDQTGSGRIEKALMSGNPSHLHSTVLEVLRNMEKSGFVAKAPGVSNDTIWKGVPGRAGPVRQFLDNPHPKFARQFII